MKTQKIILSILFLFVNLISVAQLNPVQNLSWDHWYQYPHNFYILQWSPPEHSPNDTLVGYNIYRNDELYRFYTDTIAEHTVSYDTTFGGEDFVYTYNGEFYIHVTAVYNSSHTESPYTDSVLCNGAALGKHKLRTDIISTCPNPVSDQLRVQIDADVQSASLRLYNALGQQVKQIDNISRKTETVQRGNLPEGLYVLKLTQGTKTLDVQKVIISD